MNLKQLIVNFSVRNKDRVIRSVTDDPTKELAAVKLQAEFDSVLLYAVLDLLDTNGTLSKETVDEFLEERLTEYERAVNLMESALRLVDAMPKEARDQVYQSVQDSFMKGVPDERNNGL